MLNSVINSALGNEKADLVLKNGKIIDVLNHRIVEGNVAVKDGIILGIGDYTGEKEVDVKGCYIAPGFVDSHIHIESAMVTPSQYAAAVMAKGVTTIIADPHEIANVKGEAGLAFMLNDSKKSPLEVHFMLPSCVPATPFDHSGCVIDADKTKELFNKYEFLGLGEMMNYPGVIGCVPDVLGKLESAKYIDGHAPMVKGRGLNAYACGGIKNDHECSSAEEALEKISCGFDIFIREGTGAKNLTELMKAVTPYNLRHFAFCTDDKHPAEIVSEGTISHCVDKAISLGYDPLDVYTIACYNSCVTYDLGRKGAVASGFEADILVTEDINATNIKQVYKKGLLVAENGKALFKAEHSDISSVNNTVNIDEIKPEDLNIDFNKEDVVISLNEGSLVTEGVYCENTKGLSLCANIERHNKTGNIGKCFVKGLDITNGAIAQTIGHDSHNISVIGSDSENMAVAVNALGKEGGIAVVKNNEVVAKMELPVAGIMSDKAIDEVVAEHNTIVKKAMELSPKGSNETLMILGFISLLVIPHFKLGDKGVFNVDEFRYV